MQEYLIRQPNVLSIKPGYITIENFKPGKVYKQSIEIENNSIIPIIINLKSSDRSKLILNKSLIRLDVKEKQIIDLIIQDKINYQNDNKIPKEKTLFIKITGELIDIKYIINLRYLRKKNQYKEFSDYNTIQINQPFINEYERQIPSIYYSDFKRPLYKNYTNNRKLLIDKVCNIIIKRYESDEVLSLKKEISYLMEQISLLTQKNKKIKSNNPKYFEMENNSLFILRNKLKEDENKIKIDEELEKNALIKKNSLLQIENSILAERIKFLEKKIFEKNTQFEIQKSDKNYDIMTDKNHKDNFITDDNNIYDIDDNEIYNNNINLNINNNEKEDEAEYNNKGNYKIHKTNKNNLYNNINYYDDYF